MKRPAQLGTLVSIAWDGAGELAAGHALVTRTGRTYVIVTARQQLRGKFAGRWHLRCLVSDQPAPPGTTIHPLRWYSRGRRRLVSRASAQRGSETAPPPRR